MNYIYDIVLNFDKDNLYEFYEWKDSDYPEYVLKIPVFKVDENTLYDFRNKNIKINKEFLLKIFDKTEIYNSTNIKLIRYASVFTNGKNSIAIEFDSEGNNVMKSLISLDDENDILEFSNNMKYSIIDYKITQDCIRHNEYNTRNEYEIINTIEKKINSMYILKDFKKLKYIYYEIFKEKNVDENKMYYKLINIIKNCDSRIYDIYNIITIMDKKIMN